MSQLNPKEILKRSLRSLGFQVRKPDNATSMDIRVLGYQIQRLDNPALVEMTYNLLLRFMYFKKLYDRIEDVPGDIVECGVGKGRTFFMLAALAASENKSRIVWGFDSFEGFPEPSKEDASSRNVKRGEYNILTSNGMRQILRRGGIPQAFNDEKIKLVKGFFRESLPKFQGNNVAFLHLDVDLYQSYKETLDFFWPKVAIGGVVLFDEYKQSGIAEAFPGAAKAIDEFLGEQSRRIQYDKLTRKYYIVKESCQARKDG